MKRLVIGICVLSVLLAMGITVSTVFRTAHTPTAALLEDACDRSLDGNWEDALQKLEQAQVRWERFRHFTAAFADHSPMDEIDGLFAELKIHGKEKSREMFPALCMRLSELIRAMAESHSFRWWTVL